VGGKFATSVNVTGSKIATSVNEFFATSFDSVVDTVGKFATGVNDTGGKFATDGKIWKQYQAADSLK
jgi:hypothetical protein